MKERSGLKGLQNKGALSGVHTIKFRVGAPMHASFSLHNDFLPAQPHGSSLSRPRAFPNFKLAGTDRRHERIGQEGQDDERPTFG